MEDSEHPDIEKTGRDAPVESESAEPGVAALSSDTVCFDGRRGGEPTIVPGPKSPATSPPGAAGTVMISSSSKARARIKVCDNCHFDNSLASRFCEGCGADLLSKEKERSAREHRENVGELRPASRGATPVVGAATLREGARPAQRAGMPLEKKSVHSRYVPSGEEITGAGPPGARLPGEARRVRAPSAPIYVRAEPQRRQPAEAGQTSTLVGIVVASALLVVFAGLVATLIIVILK